MSKSTKYLFIAAGCSIAALLMWYFRSVLMYIIVAAVISMIGKPIVKRLTKFHIRKFYFPRWLAALVSLILIFGILFSILLLLIPMLGEITSLVNSIEINNLSSQVSGPLQRINEYISNILPGSDKGFRIEVYILNYIKEFVNVSTFSNILTSVTSFVVDFSIGIFSIVFISFFMLMENGLLVNTITALFSDKYEAPIRRAAGSISNLLTRYFVGISIESLCIALLNGLGLIFIAGMDTELAIVLAFTSGILNIIPYVGPLTGHILALLMGLLSHYNGAMEISLLLYLSIILGVFLLTQLIDNYLFQPIIYSNSVKAHPLEIFIVILLAGHIGGVVAILMAIPGYTVLRVIMSEFLPHIKFVRKLTGNLSKEK